MLAVVKCYIITQSIFKLVGFLSMDEANHFRELKKIKIERTWINLSLTVNSCVTLIARTWAPTSCRITSWITTSASVLKSWTNFLFLSSPVFSCTRSWKRGASCLQTRATFAAFSATRSSSLSRSAMPEQRRGSRVSLRQVETLCVRGLHTLS